MTPPLSFSRLFKKKEKRSPALRETENLDDSSPSLTTKRVEGAATADSIKESENSLAFSQALSMLQNIENQKVVILSTDLAPIKESLENVLSSIGKLADDLQNENVKVEEEKFKPSVESARKIVVSSLKREVSSQVPVPISIHGSKKFQERLESMLDRFGEVSGSHSKVLNAFMKKHTNKIKGEFDTISSLKKRTNKIMDNFEQERTPVANCIDLLSRTSQMADSIKLKGEEVSNTHKEIAQLEAEYLELKRRLNNVESSSDFESTSKIIHEIELAHKDEMELRKELTDLFSHVSRALAKYSYGLSKDTTSKLHVLIDEPWKIFESTKETKEDRLQQQQLQQQQQDNLESYRSLLIDVHKAVRTGKITLKDADKVEKYFDLILNSLEDFKKRSQTTNSKLKSLEKRKDYATLNLSEDLKKKSKDRQLSIENRKIYLDRLQNEIKEKKSNLENMIRDSEECLFKVTGKHYMLNSGSQ
jgi:DNA repair exonuclease SbcCD ATPase subunit